MDAQQEYFTWRKFAIEDPDLQTELQTLTDENEIYDRFYCHLHFGTAGLRSVMGAGTNRLNIYTVRQATQGLAHYLRKRHITSSVAIAFDSRYKSELFAQEAARVLCANDITVFLNKEIQPTPVLSFCVRHCNCQAGIMITASHNAAEYNGYKCYGLDGCQMTDTAAEKVYREIQKINIFSGVRICSLQQAQNKGLLKFVENSVYASYFECVLKQSVSNAVSKTPLKVVYTPLNGAGRKLVRKVLETQGVKELIAVPEQEMPDGSFSTCPYPNPELRETFSLALTKAKENRAELVIATDPDSDRVGMAFSRNGWYTILSGNEIGALLVNYILLLRKSSGSLPKKPLIIKTLVSSNLVEQIATDYKCEVRTVLTGFKYIGEQILELEKQGQQSRFVFGFEESLGFLAGTYVRDKDAVVASMLICEMVAYYKQQGTTPTLVLEALYKKYGYYEHRNLSYVFDGPVGMEKMKTIMNKIREATITEFADVPVISCTDYLIPQQGLPSSNVVAFELNGNNSLVIRPSGTEPKIKIYLAAVSNSRQKANELLAKLQRCAEDLINL